MKAAVTHGAHDIKMEERPRPEPGPGEALVAVERAGICGSDLHLYHGSHPYAAYPVVQGHEVAGRVVAFGEGADRTLPDGARVAVEPLIACGTCYPCRQGRPNCCVRLQVLGVHRDGAFLEYIALPTAMLHDAGGLDADFAALAEPVSIGVQANHRGAVMGGEQVVVIGAGPIGSVICLAAFDRGARVMVVDRLPSRLELARHVGAEETVDASTQDVAAIVAEWTNGEGPPVVVDAVGAPAVIRECCEMVASAGRVVIVGLSMQEVSLPVIDFTRKEMTILGSRNNAGVFPEAVALVGRHQERLRHLITQRYPLDQLPAAMRFAADHPAEAEKVLIDVA